MLVQIKSPFFTAGICIRNGTVIHAAPILSFMEDWTAAKAVAYCHVRGWSWLKVEDPNAA